MYLPPISTLIDSGFKPTVYDAFPSSRFLSRDAVEQIIQGIFRSTCLRIQKLEELSGHLHPISRIRLSNGCSLTLKQSPSTNTPVLQNERYALDSEAVIFSQLSRSNLPIPRILKHEKSTPHNCSPFLLANTIPGISYASAFSSLTHPKRKDISQQIKSLRAHINAQSSPHGTFGPAAIVAADAGLSTWREAFRLMMHTILIDGENMTVNLPYTIIRKVMAVHLKALDAITEPRLVVLGLGRPQNVLIDRKTNNVTGLLDFGQAVWGDVEFGEELDVCGGVRGLVYTVYHATVAIVANHYRPQKDIEKELDARTTLTKALAQLTEDREC